MNDSSYKDEKPPRDASDQVPKAPKDRGNSDEDPERGSLEDGSFEEKLAANPELRRYAEDAVSYHEEALSENTRRAYESGWDDFCLFCEEYDFAPLPAEPGTVALYLSFLAKKIDHQTGEIQKEGLSVPSLEQRLSAIGYYHEEKGHESPTSARQVTSVMAGIRRNQKHRSEQAAPLMTYHIKRMVDSLPKKADVYAKKKRERAKTELGARLTEGEKRHLRLLERRNRALILIGYAAALRRSEIAALRFEDLRREPGHGLVIDVREGKTDQEGQGREVYLPRLESSYDPTGALDEWREAALKVDEDLERGPVFRRVTRGGNLKEGPITGRTVGNVVQEAIRLAGISGPEDYSAHSLRAGHATQATKNGVPAEIAMNTTRHASREQFSEYVRNEEEAFESASSGKLGL